jgi:hypothetical protein
VFVGVSVGVFVGVSVSMGVLVGVSVSVGVGVQRIPLVLGLVIKASVPKDNNMIITITK